MLASTVIYGGGVVRPITLKKDFKLGVGREATTRPDIFSVVMGPYMQYCPCDCEASAQKTGAKSKIWTKGNRA